MVKKKSSGPVIELKDVWRTYYLGDNVVHALKGLSFSVNKGEFVAIVGKSGSGKTTAVNQIGVLDIPSKGEIFIEGEPITELSESELAILRGKKIGYIFQKFNLIKTLSAQENVELPMIFQGISPIDRKDRAAELLTKLDMGERLINKPTELSGGQQQRVAIARALANEPEIILADEPTGNLDSKTGVIVMEYLKKLHSEGKTIILVTHDDKLSKYAQKLITLVDGKVIKEEINTKPL
ncbi:MAG: ABC transporter ATP-binding protein [Candidatus Woesearchaeota archaeon]|jgi:putative ABC transport system ATP-binding protein|nr:ABC transporter ATP-binding protein [Candidatus Woesearchaeota archaeon]